MPGEYELLSLYMNDGVNELVIIRCCSLVLLW